MNLCLLCKSSAKRSSLHEKRFHSPMPTSLSRSKGKHNPRKNTPHHKLFITLFSQVCNEIL